MLAELRPEAEVALRREAVITAVVEAEEISPSDEDVLEALAATAEREGVEAAELLERLRSSGRLEELREELAARQAIDLIAERAKPIEPGGRGPGSSCGRRRRPPWRRGAGRGRKAR